MKNLPVNCKQARYPSWTGKTNEENRKSYVQPEVNIFTGRDVDLTNVIQNGRDAGLEDKDD